MQRTQSEFHHKNWVPQAGVEGSPPPRRRHLGEHYNASDAKAMTSAPSVCDASRGPHHSAGREHDAEGTRVAKGRISSLSCNTSSKGFTLMELLMVISIILILILMAIPTFGGIKKHANETSAIVSMQTIETAEIMYTSTNPANLLTR